MNRGIIYIATALAFAFSPSMASAGCGSGDCAVGAFGTGGESSGGNAQGFHFQGEEGGATVSNSGNALSGRLNITAPDGNGSISGHIGNDGATTGHGTGFFGDWSGVCEDPFGNPEAC